MCNRKYIVIGLEGNGSEVTNIIIVNDKLTKISKLSVDRVYKNKEYIYNMYDIEENNGEALGIIDNGRCIRNPKSVLVEKDNKVTAIEISLIDNRIMGESIVYDINNCVNNRFALELLNKNHRYSVDVERLNNKYNKYMLIDNGMFGIVKSSAGAGSLGIGYELIKVDPKYITDTENIIVVPDCVTEVGISKPYKVIDTKVKYEIRMESVINIGDNAFSNCTVKSAKFGENLREIGYRAFEGSLLEEVDIPESVVRLWGGAFMDCKFLKKVTIRSLNMTKEELNSAFSGCNIEELNIPYILRDKCEDLIDRCVFCNYNYI